MKLTTKDSRTIDLNEARILANNIIFPWEYNPNRVRLWLIGNEYGPIAAAWASCETDALDEMVDAGLGDCFLVDITEPRTEAELEELCHLGNAGEPVDLTYCWMDMVNLDNLSPRDLVAFAEARANCQNTLDK